MTQEESLALALATMASLYLLLTSVHPFRVARRMKKMARVERARSAYGEAREMMYTLAREGKIDVHSEVFRRMVVTQTYILRRPDDYENVCRALTDVLLYGRRPAASGASKTQFPDAMEPVLIKMGEATMALLITRGPGVFLYAVMRRLVPWAMRHVGNKTAKRLKRTAKRWLSVETRLYATGYKLEHCRLP